MTPEEEHRLQFVLNEIEGDEIHITPAEMRIIYLRCVELLTMADIVKITGLKEKTIDSQFYNVSRRLRGKNKNLRMKITADYHFWLGMDTI